MLEKGPKSSTGREKEISEEGPIPALPLEDIDRVQSEKLAAVDEQIETIRSSLKELAHTIETEKPDVLVFLDLSARPLATPFLRYLRETMGEEAPSIRFYNDHELKGRYLHNQSDYTVHDSALKEFAGRKVFFIDETYSMGKGAVAINEAAMSAGIDGYYFAISRDPDTSAGLGTRHEHHDINEERHTAKVAALRKDGRITVYPNPLPELFTRFVARLYVHDWQPETLPIRSSPGSQGKEDATKTPIPHADSYLTPPEGMTVEEYTKALSERSHAFVQTVKDRVYEALKN